MKKKSTWIGVILIFIGVYLLFNSVIRQLAYNYDIEWLYISIRSIMDYLPPILIAGVCIGVGAKFVSKK